MEYTIEWLGDGAIDLNTVGELKKGSPLRCSQAIAEEFKKNKSFRVTGLKAESKKKEVRNAG